MSTNTDAIERNSDTVVSSEPPSNSDMVGANSLDSKTETLVDDSRVSGGETGTVMNDDSEVVLDKPISDDAVLYEPLSNRDVDAVDDSLGLKNEGLAVKPADDCSGDGDIVVRDSVYDSRVYGGEKGIVMNDNSELVLDEPISDAVVSSEPLSNRDVDAVDGVKIGTDSLGTGTETLTTKPSDTVVQDSVEDSRVSGDEKGIVMDKTEVVLDKSISDAVVLSEPMSDRDIDAVNGVKIGAESFGSETETPTMKPSDDHNGDGENIVQDSVDDSRASRDDKGIVTNHSEVVLDKSILYAVVSSEPLSNRDVDAVNEVKIRADSLDLETETLTKKPSADHNGDCDAVQDSVDDSRASRDDKGIVTENIEKVSDESEVNNEEKDGEYKVTDIVWAKVKNYPWWPGQIFDRSAATEKAKKFSNKKGHLVGYFGDQSFAWNKPPNIKPFRKNFRKLEKQSNSKPYLHAVNCALDEVSRRVDFGLACSCLSKEVYDKIKSQKFVNAGIREEDSKIDGGDRFSTVSTFKPVKAVHSVQELAREHFDGFSRLEALSVRTQLLAFFRWKGRNQLKAHDIWDELDNKLEDESELPLTEENKVVEDGKLASIGKKVSSKKRKPDVSDSDDSVPLRKERSLTNVTPKGNSSAKKTSSKKRKPDNSDSDSDDSVPLRKERSLKNVTPKGNSSAKKTSSKKRKPDNSDSDDSVPLRKERSLTNVTPKGNSSAKKTSSKKRKPDNSDSDSDDSVPLRKERSLTNVTPKGNSSAKKVSSKKRKPDVCDSDDSVPVTPKVNSSAKKTSSKKRKPDDSDSDDSIPLKKERGLTNVTPKGILSAKKTSSKKKKPDVCDSDDSDDLVPLKKVRSLTNVTPKGNSSAKRSKKGISKKATIEDNVIKEENGNGKPDSIGKQVSSKKRKPDASDIDDSVPHKKQKSSTKITSKGSLSVKRSKNNISKKATLKEENGNGTDNKKSSISSPKTFRVGDSICRIAKQISESPSILKKESEKPKNDENSATLRKSAKKDGQLVEATQTEE